MRSPKNPVTAAFMPPELRTIVIIVTVIYAELNFLRDLPRKIRPVLGALFYGTRVPAGHAIKTAPSSRDCILVR